MNEKENSQITSQLNGRIDTNRKFGSVDLDEWLFEKLDIRKGSNILDVGCGTGNHLIKLAENFPDGSYYGIDISSGSIDEAKRKAAQKNLRINFICSDAADTNALPNNFFDIITSIYALYYAGDPQKALAAMKNKLKIGGKIAVMSPYKRNNEEWYNFLSTFIKIPGKIEWIADNFMDNEVLPFAKRNFKKVDTHNFENKITVPSNQDLEKYWKSNIYHKEEYDGEFSKHAADFFRKNSKFVITKRALLAIMNSGPPDSMIQNSH